MPYSFEIKDSVNILVRLNSGTTEAPKLETIILRNMEFPNGPGVNAPMLIINAIAPIVEHPIHSVNVAIDAEIKEVQ